MQKKVFVIGLIVLVLVASSIMAATKEEVWADKPDINVVDEPSLLEKIINFFTSDEPFTIVGQDRDCWDKPYYVSFLQVGYYDSQGSYLGYWTVPQGTYAGSSIYDAATHCDSGHGLFNIYSSNILGQWTPWAEMEDWVYFYCASYQCIIELYCCPDGGCDVDSDCDSGDECITEYRVDSYLPLREPGTGDVINYYSYCSAIEGCVEPPIDCWQLDGDNCLKRTYDCDYFTYPTCPASWPYTSLSSCQADICYEKTCSQLGKECGSWSDDCGGTLNCGVCDSGETCSNGICVLSELDKLGYNQGDCDEDIDCLSGLVCVDGGGILGTGTDLCCSPGEIIEDGLCKAVEEEEEQEENGVVASATLTWTDFFSMSDEDFVEGGYYCDSDSDCPLKEGYNVTCSNDEIFAERSHDYFKDQCDDFLGFLDELSGLIMNFIPGNVDICGEYADFRIYFEDNGGVCLAESESSFGKIWDSVLLMVGSLGFPYQYGMIITIIILFSLVVFLLRALR